MGISAALETENGKKLETVEDPTNVLHRILPQFGNPTYQCLTYIDWYGDTVFNHLQAPTLLAELKTLVYEKGDAEAARVIEGIRKLAERVREEQHIYLKFYGD